MSQLRVRKNPFPGPQPYRAADKDRFFGREVIAKKIAAQVLARAVTTLHGPSGAGKSSIMQAGVIPRLIETHDFRVVRVDGWPEGEPPLPWFLRALYTDLELGDGPAKIEGTDDIHEAMALAERRSDQPILIYLDQIEQLLFPERSEADAESFLIAVDALARSPIPGLQIVLSLREDYLGRFRDRARDHRSLLAHGFRLGPMTIAEMASAVCKAATTGDPPQAWDPNKMLELMRDMRTPGQAPSDNAEVQAAYAQIVCRALFQQNAGRRVHFDEEFTDTFVRADLAALLAEKQAEEKLDAERILQLYLDASLEELGELREDARRLLADHLITSDGSRTLRTETELLRLLPPERLGPILSTLEGAAILHAEAHQGSRYFEIGHDWLARRVYEQRHLREQAEAEQRRRAEEEAARERERAEAEKRLQRVRRQRRLLAIVALASIVVATGAWALGLWALREQKKAKEAGDAARLAESRAEAKAIEASDARLMAGFRELRNSGQATMGMKLLHEVQRPELARGWIALANDALQTGTLEVTLRGAQKPFGMAAWSHAGKQVAAGSIDGKAFIWSAAGDGDGRVVAAHEKPIVSIAWSPGDDRILTASEDGTARIVAANGKGDPVVLDAQAGPLSSAAWSPDGKRVVVVAGDASARVFPAEGGAAVEIAGHSDMVWTAVFMPDGAHVLTASSDRTARIQSIDGAGEPIVLRGHKGAVRFAVPSADGAFIVTTSDDGTARVWQASGKGEPVVLKGHEDSVIQAAMSPDGTRVATASLDRTGRIFSVDGKGEPVVLQSPNTAVASVAFRPDGRYVLTGSRDRGAAVWPVSGGNPFSIPGPDAPSATAAWSPDGTRVLSAAGQPMAGGARETTIEVHRLDMLEALPRVRRPFFHAASLLPGGARAVAAFDNRTVGLFRVDGAGTTPSFSLGSEGWVGGVAANADGSTLAAFLFDGTARLVSTDGKGSVVLLGAEGPVRAGAISPDGKRVVTCSDDRRARVYHVVGGVLETTLSGHTDILTSATFSPDGAFVVTTSMDHTARVFRVDGTGEPRVLSGHGGGILAAAWSPNGARIVTASEDLRALIWDVATGAPQRSLDHEASVVAVAWSPDGKRIATSSERGTLRVWEADGAAEPLELAVGVPLLAMAFVDEGRRLVAIAEDDTTRTFTLDVEALMRGLSASNRDCLSAGWRAMYLGEAPFVAEERYAACERAAGRTPSTTEEMVP